MPTRRKPRLASRTGKLKLRLLAPATSAAARKRAAKGLERQLFNSARDARDHAVAPFSRFKVGAALRAADGRIYSGCNIENASFSLTLCAERVAVFKALSEGAQDFTHITIVTDAATLTPPCGACRQVLWEFAPHAEVILANMRGRSKRITLAKLIPNPFDSRDLDG
jgi:cytidine deaminase